jgi:MATE family multidrug resistance protein
MATLSTFFAGLGRTRVILIVNLVAAVLDTVLNYLWIFGDGRIFPSGVAGAAWSTVVSQAFGVILYGALILARASRAEFGTGVGWRFDARLFLRLLRFGLPSGLQFGLELFAFSIFMLIIGRLGAAPLAASAIAFNLNMIVFMPILGLGVGVSALVGKYLGAERPDVAERVTSNAFRLSLLYMTGCGLLYVLAPRFLLTLHAAGSDPAAFAQVSQIAVVLLRFVAVYSIFDMMNLVFAAGLKGAGDTTYPMLLSLGLSWVCMLVPAYLLCEVWGFGVYAAWCTASAYVVALGLLMRRRFRAGRWRLLRVIEQPPEPLAALV